MVGMPDPFYFFIVPGKIHHKYFHKGGSDCELTSLGVVAFKLLPELRQVLPVAGQVIFQDGFGSLDIPDNGIQ